MLDLKGKTLGRYHLIEPLGEGGMAVVYKAYDATLDRYVAIKVIRTEIGGDPSFLQRFQREAKALARLDHPYILKVLDYGEQEGMPYLVMPFVPGGTLKALMNHAFSPAEAARILAPVARALAYAHQQGIVHRDVKPANILITPSGAPTLSDFGIAKMLEAEGSTQLTATGVGIGTPDYMAPEQWLGTVDARTDVYALGIIFYQMVTGRLPYIADTPAAVLLKHMQDPLPRPSDFVPGLPESVETIIFKALAKEASARYQEMDQFAGALEKLAAGEPTGRPDAVPTESQAATLVSVPLSAPRNKPPVTMPPTAAQPAKRSIPWLAIGIGGLVVLAVLCLAGIAAVYYFRTNQPQANQPAAGAATPTVALVQGAAATPTTAPSPAPPQPAAPAQPTEAPTEAPTAAEPALTPTQPAPLTKIDGLPADIPILKNNNGDLLKQDSSEMNLYMYTTSMSVDDAAAFFKKEMESRSWKITNTTSMATPKAIMYTFEKDSRMAMINIAASNDKIMIQVMLPKNTP